MNIQITVANKVATVTGAPCIVCGNSDYTITFTFDSEWSSYTTKTARFSYLVDNEKHYIDVAFNGNTCNVPVLNNINGVSIGVYAGDLHTSTPARVNCKKSILCGDPIHDTPPTDIYNQLIGLVAGKANNNQGVANAGKHWKVGADGNLVLEDIDIPTVDQSYNPTSTNAQSGGAVAEGIDESIGDINICLSNLVDGQENASITERVSALTIPEYTAQTMPFDYTVSGTNIAINGFNAVGLADAALDKVNVVISPRYKIGATTYTVNAIGNYAFSAQTFSGDTRTDAIKTANRNIKSIQLPITVTSIGNYAFAGNDRVTDAINGTTSYISIIASITGLENVTSIGTNAFENLVYLEKLYLPKLNTLSVSMCFQCTGLKEIVLSASVTSIPANAFNRCPQLKSVNNLSNTNFNITTFGNYAFFKCYSLRKFDFVSSAVTSIGDRAFSNCGLKKNWDAMTCTFGTQATRLQNFPEASIRNHSFNKTPCVVGKNITPFNQKFDGWSGYKLGGKEAAEGEVPYNISRRGCGWCTLTTAYNMLTGQNLIPPEYNKLVELSSNSSTPYSSTSLEVAQSATHISGTYGALKLGDGGSSTTGIMLFNNTTDIQKVYDTLADGKPLYAVMVNEDSSPITTHAILIYGVASDGDILFTDSSIMRPNTDIAIAPFFKIDFLDLFTSIVTSGRNEKAQVINFATDY